MRKWNFNKEAHSIRSYINYQKLKKSNKTIEIKQGQRIPTKIQPEKEFNFRYLQRNGRLQNKSLIQKFFMILNNKNKNRNYTKKVIKNYQKTNKKMTKKEKYNQKLLKKKLNIKTKII